HLKERRSRVRPHCEKIRFSQLRQDLRRASSGAWCRGIGAIRRGGRRARLVEVEAAIKKISDLSQGERCQDRKTQEVVIAAPFAATSQDKALESSLPSSPKTG